MTTQKLNSRLQAKASHKYLVKQEAKLSHRVRNVGWRDLYHANSMYLNSYAARYVAAWQVLKDTDEARAMASKVNLWVSCGEQATVKVIIKKDWSIRIVYGFGKEKRTRQKLIDNVLRARWTIAPEQTQFAGGRTEAVRRIQEYYKQGNTHVTELDVVSCYDSFDRPEIIAKILHLPERVVRSTMIAKPLNTATSANIRVHEDTLRDILHYDEDDDDEHHMGLGSSHEEPKRPRSVPLERLQWYFAEDLATARQGLMQGAICSAFACEILLSYICCVCTASGAGKMTNYADNFFLMAKTSSELQRLTTTLAEAIRTHPAGRLSVKNSPTPHKKPFDFLGYKCTPGRRNSLTVSWSDKHDKDAKRIRVRAYRVLHSKAPDRVKRAAYRKCESEHLHKLNGFPAWLGGKQYVDMKLAAVKVYLPPVERRAAKPRRRHLNAPSRRIPPIL